MPKVEYKGVTYDSQEEVEFAMWVEEAIKADVLSDATYQPRTYILCPKQTKEVRIQLKTKIKIVEKTVETAHTYTPDWELFPGKRFHIIEDILEKDDTQSAYLVDVKGKFNQNDAWRRFSINKKHMRYQYKEVVNKVIPEEFFNKTWCPWGVMWMKNRRTPTKRKAYTGAKLINEVVG